MIDLKRIGEEQRVGQLEMLIEHTINLTKNCVDENKKTRYMVKIKSLADEYKDIVGKPYIAIKYRNEK